MCFGLTIANDISVTAKCVVDDAVFNISRDEDNAITTYYKTTMLCNGCKKINK